MPSFLQRLCTVVSETGAGDSTVRALIGRAIADTLAVAAAGFGEPVVRACLQSYAGPRCLTWSDETCESTEAAVMINAIAAHALDFDDVYLDSMTHPSTVIVPVILTAGTADDPSLLLEAMAAGLITGKAVASRLGKGHYQRGWHGTGTIGAFSAAAAAGRLAKLNPQQLAAAFALAAAMSGGLQINFSTMAKPCQAGFAAVAGVRAVRLAAAGVTAATDVFAERGFADLYGVDGTDCVSDATFALHPEQIALKLFPSCLAANRLIGVSLDARAALGPIFNAAGVRCRLTVPRGSLEVLRFDNPTNGMQAKFSAPYNVCAALIDGPPGIDHFSDAAVRRADINACMARLQIIEDPDQPSGGDLQYGHVTLEVLGDTASLGRYVRTAIPGTLEDPPGREQVRLKASNCLRKFRDEFGKSFRINEITAVIPEVQFWLGN